MQARVCLGLTLALAFVVETRREYRTVDLAGAIAVVTILIYIAYRFPNPLDIPICYGSAWRPHWPGPSSQAGRVCAPVRLRSAVVSLILCGYIFVRYEPLTYELAMLPTEGIVGSAILLFLVLEGSRRTSGFGFVAIILAMAVYVYISPNLPGDFQTRWVSPERMVAYLGLDINSMIGAILGVAVLIVIPFTIMGQVLARTGGADFFSDIAMAAMGRFRGGSAKIAVVGSALFGMISGSAVSNVLAVGIVTIPTMIKSGFSRYKAAAIESVGSTGGQLMPPVMGAVRLHHGGVPAGLLWRGLRRRSHSGHSLLRLPVHPRRPRCRQGEDRRGAGSRRSFAWRSAEIGLALPGADRLSWCSR